MSFSEASDKRKQLLKMSPFLGYNFKEEAVGKASNGMGIMSAQYDDPFENISLAKMRKNLYCLSNPQNFEEVKDGTMKFQSNHTVVLKDPQAATLSKRMAGFRLEDLSKEARLSFESPRKLQAPVRILPQNEERIKTTMDFEEKPQFLKEDYRPLVTEPTPKLGHSKSQSIGLKNSAAGTIKNMFKVNSNKNLRKRTNDRRTQSEFMLDSMIRESKPIFLRPVPCNQKRLNQAQNILPTFTRYDERVKSFYDPGTKDKNYTRWNVDKNNLLELIKKHKDVLKSNPVLIKNISELKHITGLSRQFPANVRIMGLPPKSVLNDAHSKSTNPGYTRNDYGGKPFFS